MSEGGRGEQREETIERGEKRRKKVRKMQILKNKYFATF